MGIYLEIEQICVMVMLVKLGLDLDDAYMSMQQPIFKNSRIKNLIVSDDEFQILEKGLPKFYR